MKSVVCVAILPLLFFADGLNLDFKKALKALDQQEEIFRSSNKVEDIEKRETDKEKDRESTLTKQVEDELENEHRLSPTEIKLLEFFIDFIKHEKTDHLSSDIVFHKTKKVEDNFQKRHTNDAEDKSVDVKTNIKSVNDELKSLLHDLFNKKISKHKVFEKVQVDPIANTKNVIQPESEATTESKKEIYRLMDKIVRKYVTSIKKEQEEMKDEKKNTVRKKILDDILSLVTKEHKEDDGSQEASQEETPTNNKRMKDTNESHKFLMHVDSEFAKEFWRRLGVEKEEDANVDENNKRTSFHCTTHPKTECRNVCLKSSCQELCIKTTKDYCTNI